MKDRAGGVVLCVHGEPTWGYPFRALFPHARIERLPGVGHYCFEDAPEAIAALIADFIRPHGSIDANSA